jgi:hypothetical protein
MPRVGFEPTIQEFEGAKTIHNLDRAATVIGSFIERQKLFGIVSKASVTLNNITA